MSRIIGFCREFPADWRWLAGEKEGIRDSRKEPGGYPFRGTAYYLAQAAGRGGEPLRRQVIPSAAEEERRSGELTDPLGEDRWKPLPGACPRLVHRYPSRALFLLTDVCRLHCRHCFRRRFAGGGVGPASLEEAERTADYLRERPEVKELLVSGGDPLTVGAGNLAEVLGRFRRARPDLILRVGSRVPAVDPGELTGELAEVLAGAGPLWVSVQFNHSRELTGEAREALARLVDRGVPVLNQAVLLRGVNDDPAVLEALFQGLTAARVKPYYLFQGDLVPGTAHFRVPLERGWEIVRELRRRLSGLARPLYAVDLPGGGGKVPLEPQWLVREEGGWYYFRGPDGAEGRYPAEEEFS